MWRSGIFCFCLAAALSVSAGKPVKYIFFFLPEGMGAGELELYMREKPDSVFSNFSVKVMAASWDDSGEALTSGASATAIACGVKSSGCAIGMDRAGNRYPSLAHILKKRSWKIGIVSNGIMTESAVMPFFGSNNTCHDAEINFKLICQSKYDFLSFSYIPAKIQRSTLFNELKRNGFKIFNGRQLRMMSPNHRNVLIANMRSNHIKAEAPRLADAVEYASGLLSHGGSSFFMVVACGMIDRFNHRNDAPAALREIREMDDAVKEALQFARRHPDETLILVTSGFDCGGLTISGAARSGYSVLDLPGSKENTDLIRKLLRQEKLSPEAAIDKLVRFNRMTGLKTKERNYFLGLCRDVISAKDDKLPIQRLLLALAGIRDRQNGFQFTAGKHLPRPAVLMAHGAGSELFRNIKDIVEIPHKTALAAGIGGLKND